MDKIINWFLLVIIFVFDPLAIALVIAANFAFKHKDEPKEYPLEEEIEDMRNVVNAYDDLEELIDQWPEPNEDLKEAAEDYKDEQEDWEIEDEDKEPYEVYTGPPEVQLTPLEQEIQAINNERNLSDWKKKQLIQERIYQFSKNPEGKVF
jgi:hypothetical protein